MSLHVVNGIGSNDGSVDSILEWLQMLQDQGYGDCKVMLPKGEKDYELVTGAQVSGTVLRLESLDY